MLNGIKEWFGTSGKTSSKSGSSADGTGIFVEVEELSSLSLLAQRKSRNKKAVSYTHLTLPTNSRV